MVKKSLPKEVIIVVSLVVADHAVHVLFYIEASFLMAEETLCRQNDGCNVDNYRGNTELDSHQDEF